MALHRGRMATVGPPSISDIRPVLREELGRLAEKRPQTLVQKLRDSHHNIARLLAMGIRDFEVAQRSGYSMQRVYTLKMDPAFKELLEHYRAEARAKFEESADDYLALAATNMIKAERMIADKLDDADAEGKTLPTRELVAISRDAADRLGYGKKQTTVNVNVDFAAQLDRAIARSGKVIDITPMQAMAALPFQRRV